MSVTVKAYLIGKEDCNKVVRRFDVDLDASTSFNYLKRKVRNVFGDLKSVPFEMSYKDEDGDMVLFSTDKELQMGLDLVKDDTFRIFIKKRKEQKCDSSPDISPPGSPGSSGSSGSPGSPHMGSTHHPTLHPGVFCDGCYGPVVGTRFKCIVCPDYDLCSKCQRKGFHKLHPLLPLFHPTDM